MNKPTAKPPPISVPIDYRGVWMRTLRQTPPSMGEGIPRSDTLTWARWIQTSLWHADLRVPAQAMVDRQPLPLAEMSAQQLAALTHQRAFVGCTRVDAHPEGELCTWLRRGDLHPPATEPDAAWILFDAPDRMLRIDAHAEVTEVWQRLPDSAGAIVCLAGCDEAGQDDGRRLLVTGAHLALWRGRTRPWPRGLRPGQTLLDVLLHQPEGAQDWLDHELSFGAFHAGSWTIERSTLPEREGRQHRCELHRVSAEEAEVRWDGQPSRWQVLEWEDG